MSAVQEEKEVIVNIKMKLGKKVISQIKHLHNHFEEEHNSQGYRTYLDIIPDFIKDHVQQEFPDSEIVVEMK